MARTQRWGGEIVVIVGDDRVREDYTRYLQSEELCVFWAANACEGRVLASTLRAEYFVISAGPPQIESSAVRLACLDVLGEITRDRIVRLLKGTRRSPRRRSSTRSSPALAAHATSPLAPENRVLPPTAPAPLL